MSAMTISAQTSEAARLQALEQKLNQSMSVIEQLQKRITELEQRQAPPPAQTSNAAPAVAPDVGSRVETLEHTVADLATSAGKTPADAGLPLHGFLDVGYARASGTGLNVDRSGFRLGTFDIYLTPQLGERVKGLIELAFEYDRTGVLGTDLERLQLGYVASDNLTLWAGRFHTPYGYWNTAFHHGAQIQTSITRPRMIAFEDQGGILPSHTVGFWATGKFNTDFGRVNYDAYVGNSDSLRNGTLDYNAVGYDKATPTAGFNLGISPKALPGLTVGAHGLSEKVNSYDANAVQNGQIDLRVLGGYAFFESDRWELIGEYYAFNNKDRSGSAGNNKSTAGFVQAGYQFVERWTAYTRYERASLSQNDPYFALMNNGTTNFGASYHQSVIGLRYDLDQRSAIKVQAERMIDAANANRSLSEFRLQYSARF
jgi:hypothetical protein